MDRDGVSLVECFAELTDPRVERTRRHELVDVVVIAVCGAICGLDEWTALAEYGRAKADWFRTFLSLPNGIPSRDTFRRVISRLEPQEFARCISDWIASLQKVTMGQVVAIDGKTLRRSFDRASGKGALHLVSAWAAENQVSLGQVAVDEKSNEITAIPELLELIDVAGAVVTIDAMGCQTQIARKIREEQADYVLAVKGNQETLHEEVQDFFADYEAQEQAGVPIRFHETEETGHGRRERRMYWQAQVPASIRQQDKWADVRTIGMTVNERTENGRTTVERRYYLSSLPLKVRQFARAVRGHWGIENALHWRLDVIYREDDSRIRKDHGAENMALLRRLAISLLKQETTCKRGIKTKQLKAGWDNDYLLKALSVGRPN